MVSTMARVTTCGVRLPATSTAGGESAPRRGIRGGLNYT
jgi:hypothetical protein